MKGYELCKCFRAFNTVYGKLSPGKLSPRKIVTPYPNPKLSRKANAGGFVRRGQSSGGQFYGQDLNGAFQTKINVTSSVE